MCCGGSHPPDTRPAAPARLAADHPTCCTRAPSMPLGLRSTRMRWLSVPPLTMLYPSSLMLQAGRQAGGMQETSQGACRRRRLGDVGSARAGLPRPTPLPSVCRCPSSAAPRSCPDAPCRQRARVGDHLLLILLKLLQSSTERGSEVESRAEAAMLVSSSSSSSSSGSSCSRQPATPAPTAASATAIAASASASSAVPAAARQPARIPTGVFAILSATARPEMVWLWGPPCGDATDNRRSVEACGAARSRRAAHPRH